MGFDNTPPMASLNERTMAARLRFRHIEAFRAAMITGSITGAANKLHVTQPAVSHLMNEMEDILGFTLFDRRGGRITPKEDAEVFFTEIERCFLGLDHINDFALRMRSSSAKTIIVAAVPVLSVSLLPPAIKSYQETVAPDFFTINSRMGEQVVEWVNFQRVDIGLGLATQSIPGMVAEQIAAVRLVCAIPKDNPLSQKPVITAQDLARQPFISMAKAEGVQSMIDGALAENGVQPYYVAECALTVAACAMVEAGVGLTLVEPFVAQPIRLPNVVFRPFEPEITVDFYAYWLKAQTPHFPRAKFLEILKRVARDLNRLVTGPEDS